MNRPATPVGMRADDASHRWVRSMSPGIPFGNGFSFRLGPWKLEPRDHDQRRRDAEFSRKVRSTQA